MSQPLDIHRRVHAVHAFTRLAEAGALAAANKRVSNLLEKQAGDVIGEVSEDLLQESAEQELARLIPQKAEALTALLEAGQYTEGLAMLADLQAPVDAFFDQVMVMAEDPALRENRLRLLKSLRSLFLRIADISLLVVGK